MDAFQAMYRIMVKDPVWKESSKTRVCFMAMFFLACRENGTVDASYSYISHIAGVTIDDAVEAFARMEALGKDSKFRLVRYGTVWKFPCFKQVDRLAMTGSAGHRPLRSSSRGIGGYVYYAVCGQRVKIGFSMNPWSRVREIARSMKGTKLVTYERGTYAREKFRHRQFEEFNIHGEWFYLSKELSDHINNIKATKSTSK